MDVFYKGRWYRVVAQRECSVEFCSKSVRSSGATLCEGHYGQRRRGKPFTELKPRRLGGDGTCLIEGCEKPRGRARYCSMHSARIRRSGDPDAFIHQRDRKRLRGEAHPGWTGDSASYNAIHLRIKKVRGNARDHICCECGRTAHQWAFFHNRDAGRESEYGPFSTSLEDYEAMCVPCHKAMDLAYIAVASQ